MGGNCLKGGSLSDALKNGEGRYIFECGKWPPFFCSPFSGFGFRWGEFVTLVLALGQRRGWGGKRAWVPVRAFFVFDFSLLVTVLAFSGRCFPLFLPPSRTTPWWRGFRAKWPSWTYVTAPHPLAPRVESTARDANMAFGNHKVPELDGAAALLTSLRNYLAPDEMDSAYWDAVNLSHFRKTTQTAGEYSAQFDLLRRKAEGPTQPGGGFPQASGDALCFQNAISPRREKSLVLVMQGVAHRMGRSFGPIRSSGKQGVLPAVDNCAGGSPRGGTGNRELRIIRS